MLTQINELHSFIAKASSSSGEDCDSLPPDRKIETPKYMWQSLATQFSSKCPQWEATKENTNPQVFVQASGVRQHAVEG